MIFYYFSSIDIFVIIAIFNNQILLEFYFIKPYFYKSFLLNFNQNFLVPRNTILVKMKRLNMNKSKGYSKYTTIVYLCVFLNVLFWCNILSLYLKGGYFLIMHFNSTISLLFLCLIMRLFTVIIELTKETREK